MNDELSTKVQQIAQLLGHDSVPDNVKELISLLASSGDTSSKVDDAAAPTGSEAPRQNSTRLSPDNNPAPAVNSQQTNYQATATQADSGTSPPINQDVINSARSALDRLKTVNDPRINLLNAIKPFMNNRRQKKISNCIQLLQIASLSRLLNEQEKQTR